jgi:hypothetical protein
MNLIAFQSYCGKRASIAQIHRDSRPHFAMAISRIEALPTWVEYTDSWAGMISSIGVLAGQLNELRPALNMNLSKSHIS